MPSKASNTHQLSYVDPFPVRVAPTTPNELLLLAESQWIFTPAELNLTPSCRLGLDPEKERENRSKGVNFITQVGILLKLPQITLATASVFLHRFYMRHSMVEDKTNGLPAYHYYSCAATAIFLATKVEENCRKMKELVIACVRVAQKNPAKIVDEQDKEYWRWKDTILALEDTLLEALCFDVTLEPPYKTLFTYLSYFGEETNKPLRNAAWAFCNDSNLTMLCLLYPSRTIAAAALYAAAKHCDVRFLDDPAGRPWWEVVGVDLPSIRRACNYMARIYERAPLRAHTGESMYQHTPEDGDEDAAKTREHRAAIEPRRGSNVSSIGSEVSRKRVRESEEGEVRGGRSDDEDHNDPENYLPWGGRSPKKVRVATNGVTGMGPVEREGETGTEAKDVTTTNGDVAVVVENAVAQPPDSGGLISPDLGGNGSEEGEL